MSAGLHISISAETVGHIGGLAISNSMLTSLIVSGLLIAFAVAVRASLTRDHRPSGLQNLAEWMLEGLTGLVDGVTGSDKRTRHFLPFITSFFLFILLNNWLGLLPGVGTIGFREVEGKTEHAQLLPSTVDQPSLQVQASEAVVTESNHAVAEPVQEGQTEVHALPTATDSQHETAAPTHTEGVFVPYFRAGTADLNTTIALATISVFLTQIFGVMYLKLGYFGKFFNFSSPIAAFVGLLELVLEFAKIISFAFRLFGNIFAGEVLLAVISFLVPVIAPMPFYGLEVIVGAIQALVFSMLSVVFFNMATSSHDEH